MRGASPVIIAFVLAAAAPVGGSSGDAGAQVPSVDYRVRVDTAHPEIVEVAIRIAHAPARLRLAMKVHPEYDARYWRYLSLVRAGDTGSDAHASVVRLDSTLWEATLPGGHGVVRYTVRIQKPATAARRAWQSFIGRTTALINPPDVFLYLPDFARSPITGSLDVPREWQVATSLRVMPGRRFVAPNAATLLDSPILMGDLREWSFSERGTRFHVVYAPLPDAAPFDTTALLDGIHRLARATLDVFGRAPAADYWFLLQDGATDALEHRASLTLGLPSTSLARNAHAAIMELAHEFFHAWNLVVIHPDSYGDLSYRPPSPTGGLWWGEGVTLYYADALVRRAGLADSATARLARLRQLLTSYYAASWARRVSPERASAAFGRSPVVDPDATGGYYLQGELLGHILDAMVRDSTHDRRTLDDVMRALYSSSASGAGFTSASLERTVDSVCGCHSDGLFASQVHGSGPLDVEPVLARLGLTATVDSVAAADSAGVPLPDLRVSIDFTHAEGPLRLVIPAPTSIWGMSGLRTGDVLDSVNGQQVSSFGEMRRALQALHVGDTAVIAVDRDEQSEVFRVPLAGYLVPRVRFSDRGRVTDEERARRARWSEGW